MGDVETDAECVLSPNEEVETDSKGIKNITKHIYYFV